MNRILYVPGKNPKPPIEKYRQLLLRGLRRYFWRAEGSAFNLIGWNQLSHQSDRPPGPEAGHQRIDMARPDDRSCWP